MIISARSKDWPASEDITWQIRQSSICSLMDSPTHWPSMWPNSMAPATLTIGNAGLLSTIPRICGSNPGSTTRDEAKDVPHKNNGKKAFTKKRDDAMDTTPGRVKARATTTRPPLTDEEREKMKKEGRCFRCRKQGHLSRYCPEKPSQARGNPSGEESEEETIQATVSKPPPKQTNPFLAKKKTTAQDIIRLITDAEDDVKDTIIQEVFMKQDF